MGLRFWKILNPKAIKSAKKPSCWTPELKLLKKSPEYM